MWERYENSERKYEKYENSTKNMRNVWKYDECIKKIYMIIVQKI